MHRVVRHADAGDRAAVIQLPSAAAQAGRNAADSDRARGWLKGAMLALAVLAIAAAVVSWDAQYVLVRTVKHNPAVAALEAGIPDIGALIFATLGIALALHARRAVRARLLNIACVGISLAMNALASTPGWRDLAIWVMPSAVYALASDTLIGVVRAWVIARARRTGEALADDEPTPIALIGTSLKWLLRLSLAPASTLAGFRRWVIDECPVAPGRMASTSRKPIDQPRTTRVLPAGRKPGTGKQARLLELASQRHDLATIPLKSVSRIATALAAEVDLAPGTARRVLLAHVRTLQSTMNDTEESR
ncbi:MAG TPA: hypothetical protein VFQ44_22335 [Streptosporangiaceae bacterium]|nr:hypothetical protein [Streptosporangiaceae bacterium]